MGVKDGDQSNVSTGNQEKSPRYEGELPMGENLTLESPMTPLAEAIRQYILDDLRQQDLRKPVPHDMKTLSAPVAPRDGDWPVEKGFPDPVQNAILDTLKIQKSLGTGLNARSDARPCMIDPGLITPPEIMYSLQRAVLGTVDGDHPAAARYRGRSWRKLLAYEPDPKVLSQRMSRWLGALESLGTEKLTPVVKDSLGIKRIELNTERIILLQWNRSFPQDGFRPNQIIRCFDAGQVSEFSTRMTYPHSARLLSFLRERDEFEYVRTFDFEFEKRSQTMEEVIAYINRKETLRGLSIGAAWWDSFLGLGRQGGQLQLDFKNLCSLTIPGLERLRPEARERFKYIHFNDGIIPNGLLAKIFRSIDKESVERALVRMVRETFPRASTMSFTIPTWQNAEDPTTPIYPLLRIMAQSGIKSIQLKIAFRATRKLNTFLSQLPTLAGVESLSINLNFYEQNLNLALLLERFPDLHHLAVRGISSVDLEAEDLARLKSPSKLKLLGFSMCKERISFPQKTVRLTHDTFPLLRQVSIHNCKAIAENISVPPQKIDMWVRNLTPGELMEIALKAKSDRRPEDQRLGDPVQ